MNFYLRLKQISIHSRNEVDAAKILIVDRRQQSTWRRISAKCVLERHSYPVNTIHAQQLASFPQRKHRGDHRFDRWAKAVPERA